MVSTIWTSRRFWMSILDIVLSLGLYFTIKYAAPSVADDVKFVLAALQPLFIALIVSYTIEDKAAINAGVHPNYPAIKE